MLEDILMNSALPYVASSSILGELLNDSSAESLISYSRVHQFQESQIIEGTKNIVQIIGERFLNKVLCVSMP